MTPAIRVRDLHKDFRLYRQRETSLKSFLVKRRRTVSERFHALDGVSFDVQPGEVLGIIGRNGSGKSTLLKILARILVPDSGTVEIDGRVAALLEVGAGFHPEYTAIENIFLSGAIYGVPQAELARRVDQIIAFADLEQFAENPVKTYSSGMYARLGFAIAVNVDPDVLLIDEVLAVGDQSFAQRCLDRMLEFRDAGKTLVLVTHDLGAVESCCDRAIWLDAGAIRSDDLPHHVVRRYVAAVNEADEARSAAVAGGARVAVHEADAGLPLALERMRFAGADDASREVFHNGEPLRIRVEFTARVAARSPICEVDVLRHDGAPIARLSTRTARHDLGAILPGRGSRSGRWTTSS